MLSSRDWSLLELDLHLQKSGPSITAPITWRDTLAEVIINIRFSIFSRSTGTLLYQIKWLELVGAWSTLAEVWPLYHCITVSPYHCIRYRAQVTEAWSTLAEVCPSITPPITQLIRLRVTIPTLNTKPYIRCIIIISSELRAGLNRPKLPSRRLVVTNQCNQRGPVLMDVGSSAWRDFTFNSRADFDW